MTSTALSAHSASPFLFPKAEVSFVSQSVFEPISFSRAYEGMIYVIETPGPMVGKPLDAIFTHAVQQASPMWHHIKDLTSLEGSPIHDRDFYFRALKFSPCGRGVEVLSLPSMDEFFTGSGYEILTSCFFSDCKLAAFKLNSLIINAASPWSFNYAGLDHVPEVAKRPHYILELSTRKDEFHSSLIFSKILHKSIYDQWISHIPEQKETLDQVVSFVLKNRTMINARLSSVGYLLLNMTAELKDPKYVLINKIGHRIEAFFITGSTAYGLTSFVDYHIIQIKDETSFDRILTAQSTCKAYCRIFEPSFEFRFNHRSKYIAYKINGWNNFLDLITQTASSGLILRSKDIDHAVMTFIKALVVLHKGGCQLNNLAIDKMFFKDSASSKLEFKIMLSQSIPFVDGREDIKALAVVLYNLWVRYKFYGDIESFIDPLKLTPEIEAEMAAHCEALKANPGVAVAYHKKLEFIPNLLNGSLPLTEFSKQFELYYNQVHFGIAPPHGL
jgi:hypothetical protein